jgi:hypothetical protein
VEADAGRLKPVLPLLLDQKTDSQRLGQFFACDRAKSFAHPRSRTKRRGDGRRRRTGAALTLSY